MLLALGIDRRATRRPGGHHRRAGGLLPEGKVTAVRDLETGGQRVTVVGDGINDPALAADTGDVLCLFIAIQPGTCPVPFNRLSTDRTAGKGPHRRPPRSRRETGATVAEYRCAPSAADFSQKGVIGVSAYGRVRGLTSSGNGGVRASALFRAMAGDLGQRSKLKV